MADDFLSVSSHQIMVDTRQTFMNGTIRHDQMRHMTSQFDDPRMTSEVANQLIGKLAETPDPERSDGGSYLKSLMEDVGAKGAFGHEGLTDGERDAWVARLGKLDLSKQSWDAVLGNASPDQASAFGAAVARLNSVDEQVGFLVALSERMGEDDEGEYTHVGNAIAGSGGPSTWALASAGFFAEPKLSSDQLSAVVTQLKERQVNLRALISGGMSQTHTWEQWGNSYQVDRTNTWNTAPMLNILANARRADTPVRCSIAQAAIHSLPIDAAIYGTLLALDDSSFRQQLPELKRSIDQTARPSANQDAICGEVMVSMKQYHRYY